MSKNTFLIHLNKTFANSKVQACLDEIDEKSQTEFYGLFWIVQEVLSQNNNAIYKNQIDQAIYEYGGYKPHFGIADYELELLIKYEFIKEENNYYYSPFQRITLENRKNKKQSIADKEKLIKRLEEKIEFLKSDNKKFKIKKPDVVKNQASNHEQVL